MKVVNRIFKRIIYSCRRRIYRQFFFYKCKKKEIKILGKIYFFGHPKILFSGKCVIFPNVSFAGDGRIVLGSDVSIGKDVSIYASEKGGVEIGDSVGIAANCYIIDSNHGFSDQKIPIMSQPLSSGPIFIENNVWIGANSMVLKGVRIRSGTVVGAMSLVNKNLEPNSVYIGSPVKLLKKR